jgi:hypothetical protein
MQKVNKYRVYKSLSLCPVISRMTPVTISPPPSLSLSLSISLISIFVLFSHLFDCLCGIVVWVSGCRTEMYCFLWGTNWIYICYVEESRPPLWSNGHPSPRHPSTYLPFAECILTDCKYTGFFIKKKIPVYRTGMYCASCEVRNEFIDVM